VAELNNPLHDYAKGEKLHHETVNELVRRAQDETHARYAQLEHAPRDTYWGDYPLVHLFSGGGPDVACPPGGVLLAMPPGGTYAPSAWPQLVDYFSMPPGYQWAQQGAKMPRLLVNSMEPLHNGRGFGAWLASEGWVAIDDDYLDVELDGGNRDASARGFNVDYGFASGGTTMTWGPPLKRAGTITSKSFKLQPNGGSFLTLGPVRKIWDSWNEEDCYVIRAVQLLRPRVYQHYTFEQAFVENAGDYVEANSTGTNGYSSSIDNGQIWASDLSQEEGVRVPGRYRITVTALVAPVPTGGGSASWDDSGWRQQFGQVDYPQINTADFELVAHDPNSSDFVLSRAKCFVAVHSSFSKGHVLVPGGTAGGDILVSSIEYKRYHPMGSTLNMVAVADLPMDSSVALKYENGGGPIAIRSGTVTIELIDSLYAR
jgi:hypothetical protein